MRAPLQFVLVACGLLASSLALASPGDSVGTEPLDPKIYGGGLVEPCGWPTTVELGGCTGTLIHPELVITAGHCVEYGGTPSHARFGEDTGDPARLVEIAECGFHPNWQATGQDFAWCRLATPVLDIPIVPPLMGCELDALEVGAQVTVVGFGNADDELGWGYKREVETSVMALIDGEAWVGGDGLDSCQGDSGGPVFIRLDDGSWRVFGITSGGGACGEGGYYSMMHLGMPWFEGETGMDLSPCTDAAGNWDPGPRCADAPYEPGTGGGSWATGCSATPLTGAIDSCGGPFAGGEPPDPPDGDDGGDSGPTEPDQPDQPDQPDDPDDGWGDDPDDDWGDPGSGGTAYAIEFACACTTDTSRGGANGLPVLGLFGLLGLFGSVRRRRRRDYSAAPGST